MYVVMFHIHMKLHEVFKRKCCHTLGNDVLYSGGTSWSVPEGHVMRVLLMFRKFCEMFQRECTDACGSDVLGSFVRCLKRPHTCQWY